jgi:hypothetical protein
MRCAAAEGAGAPPRLVRCWSIDVRFVKGPLGVNDFSL